MPRLALSSLVLLLGCAPTPEEAPAARGPLGDRLTPGTGGTTEPVLPTLAHADAELVINEVMASNDSTYTTGGDTPDWVEIHNPNPVDIELAGFTVTDDLDEPGMHTLGDLVLPAEGFIVLLADDLTGGIHMPFKLGSEGDAFGLYDPEGVPLDQIEYTDLGDDQVAGRHPDDGPLVLLSEPTPGESNDSASVLEP